MTETTREREVWLRRGCALIVAAVATYSSYEHQSAFALHGGADPVSAAMWPLSVDGLLLLATVGLLKSGQHTSRRVRLAAWLSFLLGIAESLAANIAAAPTLAWQPVLVAGWPPVALLLAAELLTYHPRPREQTETQPSEPERESDPKTSNETKPAITPREVSTPVRPPASKPAGARRPVRSWIGSRAPTTTGARCCADGVSKAAFHLRTQIGTTGTDFDQPPAFVRRSSATIASAWTRCPQRKHSLALHTADSALVQPRGNPGLRHLTLPGENARDF